MIIVKNRKIIASLKDDVESCLSKMNVYELMSIADACNSYVFQYVDFFPMDELDEFLETKDKEECFRLGCFSDFNFSDDFVMIDGYGNLRSCSESYIKDYIDIEDLANDVIEYGDSSDYPSELSEILEDNEEETEE